MSATIKQFRAFVAVACSRSLAQASAQLHTSQPALSVASRSRRPPVQPRWPSAGSNPEGRAKLGISFRPDDLDDMDDMEFIPFERDRFVTITPAEHPLALKKSLHWRYLYEANQLSILGNWSAPEWE